jgi:Ca2+-binding EF-hand superfamily protein
MILFFKDHDALLELDEFVKGTSVLFLSKGNIKEKLEYIFDFYDSNNDNLLNAREIEEAYKAIYSMLGNKHSDLICKQLANELLSDIQFYKNKPLDKISKGISN